MSVDHPSPESPSDQSRESKPGAWGARSRTPCKLCGVPIVQRLSGKREFCGRSCASRYRHGLPPDPNHLAPSAVSEVVRVQATTKTRPAKCEGCGEDFFARKHAPQRFCSRSCKATHQHKVAAETGDVRMGRQPNGRHKPCEVCGESMYVKPHQDKAGFGRFCGRACKDKWWARNAVERPCEWCGGPMTLRPSKAGIQRFCSFGCQAEGRRKRALDRVHNGKRVHQTAKGYIYLWQPDHPNAAGYNGWYPEHRLVMEQHLGRILATEEIVHHKDENKSNNNLDNLQVVTEVEHQLLTRDEILRRRHAAKKRLADLEVLSRRQAAKLAAYESKFGLLPDASLPD